MKKLFYFTTVCVTVLLTEGFAQQKTIDRAIVKSKTEITFPENNNRGAGDNGDDQGGGRPTGMESKNTVYYKGDLVKTYSQSDFGNNTVIIDKKNKKTTTLIEAMGRKSGFYSTEEDEQVMRENMQKRMDSIRQARGNTDSARNNRQGGDVQVINTEETKKIAGYTCKKAILKTTSRQGEVNETTVWYAPDLTMPPNYPVMGNTAGGGGFARSMRGGGAGGRGGFGGIQGLEKINGFIMGYEMSRPNGFKMQTEVTSIEVNPDIDDKVFDIPKGYDLKPMSEMQNQMGRMFGRAPGGENN